MNFCVLSSLQYCSLSYLWLPIKQTRESIKKNTTISIMQIEQDPFFKNKHERGHLVKPLIHNKHSLEHYFGRDFHLVRYLLLTYV